MRLLLLRHGQTQANVDGALDTAVPGLELTALGLRQAEAAARALAGQRIESIHVSTLTRTHQTAAPLCAELGLSPSVCDGLREIGAGDLEMGTDHDSIAGYIDTVAAWLSGSLETRMPGGETGREFLERYDAAIAKIAATGTGTALLVSHGAAIRTWVGTRTTVSHADHNPTDPLHNTGCIEVSGDPESGWDLVDWHTEPIGGDYLEDRAAPDPTGRPTDD